MLELPAAGRAWSSAFTDLRRGPAADGGRVLTVLGGRGGAGASVLASRGRSEPSCPGRRGPAGRLRPTGRRLDLTLGVEAESGMRWPGVQVSGGRVPISALRSALPARGSLTVLSCDRDGPGPEPQAVAAVIEAGRRGGDTVVCDLPRQLTDAACAALDRSDLAVLVVPAEVRACAAAKRVARRVLDRGAALRLLVRGPAPGGLLASQVAEAVAVPLIGSMRPEPGLGAALDRGLFPRRSRGPLATAAKVVLKALRT